MASARRLWNRGEVTGAVRAFYEKSEACVRIGEKMSGCSPITRGVRQGCVMSPWLLYFHG